MTSILHRIQLKNVIHDSVQRDTLFTSVRDYDSKYYARFVVTEIGSERINGVCQGMNVQFFVAYRSFVSLILTRFLLVRRVSYTNTLLDIIIIIMVKRIGGIEREHFFLLITRNYELFLR